MHFILVQINYEKKSKINHIFLYQTKNIFEQLKKMGNSVAHFGPNKLKSDLLKKTFYLVEVPASKFSAAPKMAYLKSQQQQA